MKIIKGDLIELAKQGNFDIIAHGCNCFNTQNAGLAKQMKETFETHKYSLEGYNPLVQTDDWFKLVKGDINKLGQIEHKSVSLPHKDGYFNLDVVNAYTQYRYGNGNGLDCEALSLCMRKINQKFRGSRVGLPWIGCGLAGGNKDKVKTIIERELINCDVTIVEYEGA